MIKMEELYNENHEATYCPEDNKLRLYVGRVPREEYEALRKQGWTSTPKQAEAGGCNFAAVWTPEREDTALAYAGIIGDEDQSPEDRAADRAERFGGYLDKRRAEAHDYADTYEAGPRAHGYQSKARAVRAADRHDRIADKAVNAWSKAEYWQRRTAGVIAHALYKSRPDVRMGRIKKIEADQRKAEKNAGEYSALWTLWQKVKAETDPEKALKLATYAANIGFGGFDYQHPRNADRPTTSLWSLLTDEREPITGHEAAALWLEGRRAPDDPTSNSARMIEHYKLRLAYENQMLEAQGGRAAFVEMEKGGWIGKHQIHKVNKSPATGRVVSVTVLAKSSRRYDRNGEPYTEENPAPLVMAKLNVERLESEVYRPPTPEDIEALKATTRERKKAAPKKPGLINPTLAEAQEIQKLWNEREAERCSKWHSTPEPSEVAVMTQAEYSARSKGTYSPAGTIYIGEGGLPTHEQYRGNVARGAVCKLRQMSAGQFGRAHRVVVISDKPQKKLPAAIWDREKVQA